MFDQLRYWLAYRRAVRFQRTFNRQFCKALSVQAGEDIPIDDVGFHFRFFVGMATVRLDGQIYEVDYEVDGESRFKSVAHWADWRRLEATRKECI